MDDAPPFREYEPNIWPLDNASSCERKSTCPSVLGLRETTLAEDELP
jgi:hypothetical protein